MNQPPKKSEARKPVPFEDVVKRLLDTPPASTAKKQKQKKKPKK